MLASEEMLMLYTLDKLVELLMLWVHCRLHGSSFSLNHGHDIEKLPCAVGSATAGGEYFFLLTFFLLPLYSGDEVWKGIWNRTQLLVLNFCVQGLHNVIISHDKARSNHWCQ